MVFVSKMGALTLQIAKIATRVPSIKFRKGALAPTSHTSTDSSAAAPQQVKGGQAQTTTILEEVPARFQRKPISEEEIDYINRGGPA